MNLGKIISHIVKGHSTLRSCNTRNRGRVMSACNQPSGSINNAGKIYTIIVQGNLLIQMIPQIQKISIRQKDRLVSFLVLNDVQVRMRAIGLPRFHSNILIVPYHVYQRISPQQLI